MQNEIPSSSNKYENFGSIEITEDHCIAIDENNTSFNEVRKIFYIETSLNFNIFLFLCFYIWCFEVQENALPCQASDFFASPVTSSDQVPRNYTNSPTGGELMSTIFKKI